MDTQINFHMAFDDWPAWSANMRPYWTEDMVYDFSFMGDWFQSPMHGLRAWFDGEHMHYNIQKKMPHKDLCKMLGCFHSNAIIIINNNSICQHLQSK